MMIKHTVLFIDDSVELLRLPLLQIEKTADLATAGVLTSATQLEAFLSHTKPDIIVFDLFLYGEDSIAAIADCHRAHPEIPIVLYTSWEGTTLLRRALAAGVQRCVTKTAMAGVLLAAIRDTLRDQNTDDGVNDHRDRQKECMH